MKRIFVFAFLLILSFAQMAFAGDAVRDEVINNIKSGNININYYLNTAKENNININDYINAPYLNTFFDTAVKRGKPFLLVLANFNDLATAVTYLKSGYEIYTILGNNYEYVIINTNHPDNAKLLKRFKARTLPYMYLADLNKNKIVPIRPALYRKPQELTKLIKDYVNHK